MGTEEFEVGFWAAKDIAAGEELFYNYNFDSFTTIERPRNHPDFVESPIERRQQCYCGAVTCSGWLGKKSGERASSPPASTSSPPIQIKKPATKRRRLMKPTIAAAAIVSSQQSNATASSSTSASLLAAVKKQPARAVARAAKIIGKRKRMPAAMETISAPDQAPGESKDNVEADMMEDAAEPQGKEPMGEHPINSEIPPA